MEAISRSPCRSPPRRAGALPRPPRYASAPCIGHAALRDQRSDELATRREQPPSREQVLRSLRRSGRAAASSQENGCPPGRCSSSASIAMRNSSTEPPALDSRPARAVATAAARAWAVRQLQIIKDDDVDDDADDDRSLFHNSVKESSIIKYDATGRSFIHSSVKRLR